MRDISKKTADKLLKEFSKKEIKSYLRRNIIGVINKLEELKNQKKPTNEQQKNIKQLERDCIRRLEVLTIIQGYKDLEEYLKKNNHITDFKTLKDSLFKIKEV